VSLDDYTGMRRVLSELSPEFRDAWLVTLRGGWSEALSPREYWYFWMFVNGSRNYV
jgi:hypothetical protein